MSRLDLLSFLPFRLNRLAAEVSGKLAGVYATRFDVSIAEWRILATLAADSPCTAQEIVDSTRTHKSRISRGVAHLISQDLVRRGESANDRRAAELALTVKGRRLYRRMVPVVLEQEARMLACLSSAERRALDRALLKIERSLDLATADRQPASRGPSV